MDVKKMVIPINLEQKNDKSYLVTIDSLPKLTFDTKVAIITNPTVSKFHLNHLLSHLEAKVIEVITIPDGEEYKKLETIESILNHLFEKKFDRKSTLIALGGGVIGDMTGFCASIYQRGIEFIQIPTTLLAQVDASVGGKTGFNNKYGKNLVGAFYQPSAVYIDTAFLKTLPDREFNAGIAEVIKIFVMFDKEYFNYLNNCDLSEYLKLQTIIQRCVTLKAEVVSLDEKESGVRAVLNYGHTFAHVIENETNYTTYLHGEAVSIGMIMANTLAYELGLFTMEEMELVQDMLIKHHLPIEYKIKDIDAFYDKFFLDKKSHDDKIKFILPNGLGNYIMKDDIPQETIKRVLSYFKEDSV
jgi:3-dehydroquinate synthase